MSETRPRRYQPKLFMLGDDQIDFVNRKALARNPQGRGAREQSRVVRQAIAFAEANERAFDTFAIAKPEI
jgi:hypothetical protein